MKKLGIPLAIVLAALVLGSSFMWVQYNKQESIERQKQMEIDQENFVRLEQKEVAEKKAAEEDLNESLYEFCVEDADDAYWSYMKINGTEKEDGTIWAEDRFWDRGEKNKQTAIDNCYTKYKL